MSFVARLVIGQANKMRRIQDYLIFEDGEIENFLIEFAETWRKHSPGSDIKSRIEHESDGYQKAVFDFSFASDFISFAGSMVVTNLAESAIAEAKMREKKDVKKYATKYMVRTLESIEKNFPAFVDSLSLVAHKNVQAEMEGRAIKADELAAINDLHARLVADSIHNKQGKGRAAKSDVEIESILKNIVLPAGKLTVNRLVTLSGEAGTPLGYETIKSYLQKKSLIVDKDIKEKKLRKYLTEKSFG